MLVVMFTESIENQHFLTTKDRSTRQYYAYRDPSNSVYLVKLQILIQNVLLCIM